MNGIWKWIMYLIAFMFAFGVLGGCTIALEGGGEMSIGMRNDNFLVLRHTIDGDKEGKKAQLRVEIDEPILNALLSGDDDAGVVDSTQPN